MPRINPISRLDREIAARIKYFRQNSKCTRSYLASLIGTKPGSITRIELGRVPLKYNVARSIFSNLKINPLWAATGRGEPKMNILLPNSTQLKVPDNAVFSEVFSRHLLKFFESKKADSKSEIVLRYQRGKLAASLIETWFRDVPDGQIGEFEKCMDKAREEFFSKIPPESPDRILQRRIWYTTFSLELAQKIAASAAVNAKSHLTNATTSDITLEVKPHLPSLLARLNRVTKETGKMSVLAKYLGVPLASVSRWLSGKREPGGETTLQLLHWVEQQERQK
jgi:transcriptional regulator with XRE-family HTH domain